MKKNIFFIFFVLVYLNSYCQDWDIPEEYQKKSNTSEILSLNIKKRNTLFLSELALYTGSLVGLNELWYSKYDKDNFHFINDNGEWLQMDKLGHLTASYYSGVVGIKAYKWTGMKRKNAIWYGGLTGTFFLTIIEILDGYSAEWGASSGDLLANGFGSLVAISQELYWNEQRIQLKYSFRPSRWSDQNPEQLGNNLVEKIFKDYNGQTYWISFNLKSLFNIQKENFPHWLSVSLGHSGNKMLSPYQPNDGEGKNWYPKRKRQFLLSLDVDLNKIKTNNKYLNTILHTFGFLKFPMPTLELSNNKLYWHPIYY